MGDNSAKIPYSGHVMEINAPRKDGRRPIQIAAILIKQRCCNPKNPGYKNYGAKGVKMWSGWMDDYRAFEKYCINNGWRDGLEIHRKNDEGDYEPGNIMFVTKREHKLLNKRNVVSEKMVKEVHKLRNAGKKFREISQITGLREVVISNILTGVHWKDYQPEKSEQGIKVDVNTMAKKLTLEEVRNILKARHFEGKSIYQLAKDYGVQKLTIRNIIKGRFWNHIFREFNYVRMFLQPSPTAAYAPLPT